VAVWGRDREKAAALATALTMQGFEAQPTDDLKDALRWADIVSAATGATEPLIRGDWLRPGAHVDLIGAYKPNMRECDDATVQCATLFVDTREGALTEAGDLLIPIGKGVLSADDVKADLFDLARGAHPGRRMPDEITLFKSVGAALEDLAAANLVYEAG
jgi:ornithine cyclodeaminase